MTRLLSIAFSIGLTTGFDPAMAQTPAPAAARAPDAADPRSAHARLCRGQGIARRRESSGKCRRQFHPWPHSQPGAGDDGAGRRAAGNGVRLHDESADSKIYPGIAREPDTFGTPDPTDPAKLVVTTSHPAPYTRQVAVYVPKQYVPGTAAPFIVGRGRTGPRCCSRRWTI